MDLSLLPLIFSLIPTVAPRLLHAYNTDDKTSRLMVKRFSTVSDTQRGSQNYMEKRRERWEIEVTRWRRTGIESGDRKISFLISIQLFIYLGHRIKKGRWECVCVCVCVCVYMLGSVCVCVCV